MKRKNFKNLPSTETPITADNLNELQNNIEESCVIVSPTQPTTNEKVWIQKGKNLIAQFYIGSYYNQNTNKIENSANVCRTDYIKIENNVDYIFSHFLGETAKYGWIHCFDKNYNFIQTINQDMITSSFNVSNMNVKYIMISVYSENYSNETWMQLEQGSTATQYEPYVERKINVDGEEFLNVEKINKTNYSTEEQVIGTWIDGKPIYRKVITDTTALPTGETDIPHNISNLKMCINMRAFKWDVGAEMVYLFPYTTTSANETFVIQVTGTNIKIRTKDSWSSSNTTYFILEYTKTTD